MVPIVKQSALESTRMGIRIRMDNRNALFLHIYGRMVCTQGATKKIDGFIPLTMAFKYFLESNIFLLQTTRIGFNRYSIVAHISALHPLQ